MTDILTSLQHKWTLAYLRLGNATEASREAGYKGNDVTLASVGYENLNKPQIAKVLDVYRKEAENLALLDRKWVLLALKQNAERAMQAVKVFGKDGKPTGEYTYNGAVANKAYELIGQEIGMFKKQVEHSGDINHNLTSPFNDFTIDELRAWLVAERAKLALPKPDAIDVENKALPEATG